MSSHMAMDPGKAHENHERGKRALRRFPDSNKVGIKGPGLSAWGSANDIALPAGLYDVILTDTKAVARVGTNEIILESIGNDAEIATIDRALENASGVYRIEQQSQTFELGGPDAFTVLNQTCGVNFAEESVGKIVYTRVAGVSCGIIPLNADSSSPVFRIWVDYTLAPYLWETLLEIIREL